MAETGPADATGMPHWYGIDIGGTKIELVACGDDLRSAYRKRVATPAQDYAAFLRSVETLVREAEAELGGACRAVGVGGPHQCFHGLQERGVVLGRRGHALAMHDLKCTSRKSMPRT